MIEPTSYFSGAPQGWAQDGMYMASWSLLVQFLMCLIMPIFTGKTYTTDSLDGSLALLLSRRFRVHAPAEDALRPGRDILLLVVSVIPQVML